MNAAALHAERLHKSIVLASGERLPLVRGVSLSLAAGESAAVVGRSGSGKSTLLALLGLLSPADSGALRLGGRDTARLSDRQLSEVRGREIGFVFQNYSLLPHLTAAENVAMPLTQGRRLGRAEIRRRTAAALAEVGLADRADSRPRQLSGGEQQRTAIARALAGSPSVVLADEPTGALDVGTAEQVLTVLLESARSRGAALLVVTHDLAVAERMDRVLRLDRGALVEERQEAPCG
ncbi:ABC transporter ATP-binding protein [Streptacidiphilus sp. N1-12]|uniref:ABC transporter ATP-binding protein n=2 Tax=Streptacidiphilus alkalitolerans TaxID=3342712 RepID=A0ABV6V9P1_9ACTN